MRAGARRAKLHVPAQNGYSHGEHLEGLPGVKHLDKARMTRDGTKGGTLLAAIGIGLKRVRQLHSKIVLADEVLVSVGSFNWLSADAFACRASRSTSAAASSPTWPSRGSRSRDRDQRQARIAMLAPGAACYVPVLEEKAPPERGFRSCL